MKTVNHVKYIKKQMEVSKKVIPIDVDNFKKEAVAGISKTNLLKVIKHNRIFDACLNNTVSCHQPGFVVIRKAYLPLPKRRKKHLTDCGTNVRNAKRPIP